jgi:hypothetical protein
VLKRVLKQKVPLQLLLNRPPKQQVPLQLLLNRPPKLVLKQVLKQKVTLQLLLNPRPPKHERRESQLEARPHAESVNVLAITDTGVPHAKKHSIRYACSR